MRFKGGAMRVNEYPIQDVMKHLGIKQEGGRFEHTLVTS